MTIKINQLDLDRKIEDSIALSAVKLIQKSDEAAYHDMASKMHKATSVDDMRQYRARFISDIEQGFEKNMCWVRTASIDFKKQLSNISVMGLTDVFGTEEAYTSNILGIAQRLHLTHRETGDEQKTVPYCLTIHWRGIRPMVYTRHTINPIFAENNYHGYTPASLIYMTCNVAKFKEEGDRGHNQVLQEVRDKFPNDIPLNLEQTVGMIRQNPDVMDKSKVLVLDQYYKNEKGEEFVYVIEPEDLGVTIKAMPKNASFKGYVFFTAQAFIDINGFVSKK